MCMHNTQLGLADVHENAPIAEDDDGEWKEHADGDVKDGVLVRQCPVPQTLLRFAVESVRRPAGVAGHVECDSDHPRRGDNGDVHATAENTAVGGVMTDVDVAVDADTADAKQRHDAAGDAETGADRAQPLTTVVKQRRTNNRTCRDNAYNIYISLFTIKMVVHLRQLNKIYNLTYKRLKQSSPNAHAMRYTNNFAW